MPISISNGGGITGEALAMARKADLSKSVLPELFSTFCTVTEPSLAIFTAMIASTF